MKLNIVLVKHEPPNQLSVSSNGSNWVKRIVVLVYVNRRGLSVSSNGSNWVKRRWGASSTGAALIFQYPRTDRIG